MDCPFTRHGTCFNICLEPRKKNSIFGILKRIKNFGIGAYGPLRFMFFYFFIAILFYIISFYFIAPILGPSPYLVWATFVAQVRSASIESHLVFWLLYRVACCTRRRSLSAINCFLLGESAIERRNK